MIISTTTTEQASELVDTVESSPTLHRLADVQLRAALAPSQHRSVKRYSKLYARRSRVYTQIVALKHGRQDGTIQPQETPTKPKTIRTTVGIRRSRLLDELRRWNSKRQTNRTRTTHAGPRIAPSFLVTPEVDLRRSDNVRVRRLTGSLARRL